MFGLFSQQNDWSPLPFEEIKKRARLLVIDDNGFPYKAIFERDGYVIDEWTDVDDLLKLEQNYFDVILLDVQGVGRRLSSEQGLGILQHIRKTAPAQIVIAFSNAEFSLKYQDFFRMADATLSKGADYVDFKRKVDELLRSRFSLGFYIEKVTAVVGTKVDDPDKLEKETRKAILRNQPNKLKEYLLSKLSDTKTIESIVGVVKLAIKVHSAWKP